MTGLKLEIVSGWKFVNAGPDRLRTGNETKCLAVVEVVERFDAHAIANEYVFLRVRIPRADGKHAIPFVNAGEPVLDQRLQHDFGIARRAKLLSLFAKFLL